MTDPLERRLRDAMKAYAETVTPEDIDRSREQSVTNAADASTGAAHSRWPWRLSIAGLAAAAIVIGGLGIGTLSEPSRSPQADPVPETSETSTDTGRSTPDRTTSTTSTGSTRSSAPESSRTTAPKQPAPTPKHTTTTQRPDPEPSKSSTPPPPPEREPRSPKTGTPTESAEPPTSVMTRSPQEPARLQVNVDASPAQGTQLSWRATATGTASSDSPSGGVLGYTVDHGDGTTESQQVRSGCDGESPVRPVTFSTGDRQHDYGRSGTFRVRVQVQYCSDHGKTESGTGTRTVQIP